ncbi:MAG: CPBP family intramembrane glutamic endopeptidase [Ilumatobacteraceae bacterium]
MSSPKLSPLVTTGDRAAVPVGQACVFWLGAWMVGQVVATAVGLASGATTIAEAGPGWLLGVALAGWIPFLVVLYTLGKRYGIGSFGPDWGLTFRPIDLLGVPIGVVTQLVVLPLLYWPLQSVWPDTFSETKIQERAKTLFDSASGAGVLLLVVVVVFGAPLVEELVYRGLLQGAFTRRYHEVASVVLVALWFAVIHFQPIETPGLFVVGLVLGFAALFTRRLGMGVVAHMSFNATGLVLVAMV